MLNRLMLSRSIVMALVRRTWEWLGDFGHRSENIDDVDHSCLRDNLRVRGEADTTVWSWWSLWKKIYVDLWFAYEILIVERRPVAHRE